MKVFGQLQVGAEWLQLLPIYLRIAYDLAPGWLWTHKS